MKTTKHAITRSQQRGIQPEVIEVILRLGTTRRRPGGAEEYVFFKKDKTKFLTDLKRIQRLIERASDKGILLQWNGTILTVYHLQ